MDDADRPRPRLAPRTPTELGESAREVYDRIVVSRSQGRTSPFPLVDAEGALGGPFNAMVAAPHVGGPLADLGAALRFRGHLTDRAREMSILTVAARSQSEFEWQSHYTIAKSLGISDDILDAIRVGDGLSAVIDVVERAVVAASSSLIADGDLGEIEYAELVDLVGEDGVIELVVLVGYYELLARLLRVFRVPTTSLGPDRTTGG